MQDYSSRVSIVIPCEETSIFCSHGRIIFSSPILSLTLIAVALGVSPLVFLGPSISVGALAEGAAVSEAGAIAVLCLALAALACARRKSAA